MEASEQILRLYYDNQYVTEELGMLVNMYGNINDKKYWTVNYMESVRKVMEQALTEVEKIQDKQEYEKNY